MATSTTPRTRKTAAPKDQASKPAAKKATTRKAAASKATPANHTKAPAKKATPRRTAAKDTGSATKKATTSAARTKATKPAVKKSSAWPEFITHKMITAHHQARIHGLPTRNIRDWKELPTGIAAIAFPSGARLDHTPTEDAPFHANTPCPQGVTHRQGIHTVDDLKAAEATAKACEDWHGESKPQHLSARLSVAKKAAAETQPMSTQAIADHIAKQLADQQPKEHPQP
jgi:hypothetical protein